MNRLNWKQVAPALALLLLFALISTCQWGRWSRDRAALIQQADSLRVQSRADSTANTERLATVTAALQAERQAAHDSAGRAIGEANRLRAERRRLMAAAGRVDTVAAVPEAVPVADSALTLCEEETTVLRAALEFRRLEADAATQEAMAARGALALEQRSASDLRVMNSQLSRQLASASPPCRILFWGCPSRTAMAVGGVIVGAVGTYIISGSR